MLALEPLTDSERLRIVYLLITSPTSEGGAGITPRKGEWASVESIFPLHNHSFNKEWLKRWSGKVFISTEDLTQIRDRFGEKVRILEPGLFIIRLIKAQIAFYFAFLQAYAFFLVFPAIVGAIARYCLPQFSLIYAIAIGLWSAVFIEYWQRQEVELAVRWGVRGVSSIQHSRPEFKYEKEVFDKVTGEKILVFSPRKRLMRQLLQVPFAILAIVVLGGLIATCFGIEIFISEVYNGPMKWLLVSLMVSKTTR
jgi:anoctamin-10